MLPIELFGWIISMILGVIFICSLVVLSKEPTSGTEKASSFTQSTVPEKNIKDRPTIRVY
jgi:hypothetical protein